MLPGLAHRGTIQHRVPPMQNLTLGLAFLDNDLLVAGGFGGVIIYEISNLSRLYHLRGPGECEP